MSEKIGSLYKRLNAVLADIGSVPKNGHNDYDNYSYVMAGDLVDPLILRPRGEQQLGVGSHLGIVELAIHGEQM